MAALYARLPGGNRRRTPERILVIRLGNLGDIVCTLPAFHALRRAYPDAHLTLLTSPTHRGAPGAAEVLAHDSTFDEMLVYYADESGRPGEVAQLARRLRALRPDTGVLLNCDRSEFGNAAKHLTLMMLAGVRRFYGYTLVEWHEFSTQATDRFLHRIKGIAPGAVVEDFPWLHVSPEEEVAAERLLAGSAGRRLVAIQPGAKRSTNLWPVDRFVAVGRAVAARGDCAVVLTGGAGEEARNAAIARELGPSCVDLTGRTSVGTLAAVLARCALLVTNDTGVMHVAAAMGTRCVAIFSGRDFPELWHPYGEGHVVLRAPIECSPCRVEPCPLYALPECIARVTVEQVLQAVEGVLGAVR
jgi:ADP-heptose:LPS heptosyltransferase